MSRYSASKTEPSQGNPGKEKVGESNRTLEHSAFTPQSQSHDSKTEFLEQYEAEKSLRGSASDPRVLALREEESRIQAELVKARTALFGTEKHLTALQNELDSQYKPGLSNFFLMVSGAREGTQNLVKAEVELLDTQQDAVLGLINALRVVRAAEKSLLEHEQQGKKLENAGKLIEAQERYNLAQESFLAVQTTNNLKAVWSTPEYQRNVRAAVRKLTGSIQVLDTTETALRTTRSVLVVTGATIATGPFGVLGGTLAGTGIGVVSNFPEALGHIYYGNKSTKDAVVDAGIQTAKDAKSSLLAALFQKIPLFKAGSGVVHQKVLVNALPSLQNSAALTLTKEIQVGVLGYLTSLAEAIWSTQKGPEQKEHPKNAEKERKAEDTSDSESLTQRAALKMKTKPERITRIPIRNEIESAATKLKETIPQTKKEQTPKDQNISEPFQKAHAPERPNPKTAITNGNSAPLANSQLLDSTVNHHKVTAAQDIDYEGVDLLTQKNAENLNDSPAHFKKGNRTTEDPERTFKSDDSHQRKEPSRLSARRAATSKRRLEEFVGLELDPEAERFEERVSSHIRSIANNESAVLTKEPLRIDPLLSKESLLTNPVQTVNTGERILLLEEWKGEPSQMKCIAVPITLKAEIDVGMPLKDGVPRFIVSDIHIPHSVTEVNREILVDVSQKEASQLVVPKTLSVSNTLDLIVGVGNSDTKTDRNLNFDRNPKSDVIPFAASNKSAQQLDIVNQQSTTIGEGVTQVVTVTRARQFTANPDTEISRSLVPSLDGKTLHKAPPLVATEPKMHTLKANNFVPFSAQIQQPLKESRVTFATSSGAKPFNQEATYKPRGATLQPPNTRELGVKASAKDSLAPAKQRDIVNKSDSRARDALRANGQKGASPSAAYPAEQKSLPSREPQAITEARKHKGNYGSKAPIVSEASQSDNTRTRDALLVEKTSLREALIRQIAAPRDKSISSEEIRNMLARLKTIESLLSLQNKPKALQMTGSGSASPKDRKVPTKSNHLMEAQVIKRDSKHPDLQHKISRSTRVHDRTESRSRQWVTPKNPELTKYSIRIGLAPDEARQKPPRRKQNPLNVQQTTTPKK